MPAAPDPRGNSSEKTSLFAVHGILASRLPCAVHKTHSPKTHINESHHIYWQWLQHLLWGKVVHDDRLIVCATGHNNIHEAGRLFIVNGSFPVWCVGQERHFAQWAIARFISDGGTMAQARAHLLGGSSSD